MGRFYEDLKEAFEEIISYRKGKVALRSEKIYSTTSLHSFCRHAYQANPTSHVVGLMPRKHDKEDLLDTHDDKMNATL